MAYSRYMTRPDQEQKKKVEGKRKKRTAKQENIYAHTSTKIKKTLSRPTPKYVFTSPSYQALWMSSHTANGQNVPSVTSLSP